MSDMSIVERSKNTLNAVSTEGMPSESSSEVQRIFDSTDWMSESASTEPTIEKHPKGCPCNECFETFFDRIGFDDSADDGMTSEENAYHFILGAYEDSEELLEHLTGLLEDVKRKAHQQLWLIENLEAKVSELVVEVRINALRESKSSSRELRQTKANLRFKETQERRAAGKQKRRIKKGRQDWTTKPLRLERRRQCSDIMETI